MFCIIEGRFQGYFARTGLISETHYLCAFWRFTIYIYIVSFRFYHLQLYLPFAFCFSFSFVLIYSFVFLPTFHRFRIFETTHSSIEMTLSSPFGTLFSLFPKNSIQPVFFKRPSLCWKNSGWICIFEHFTGIFTTKLCSNAPFLAYFRHFSAYFAPFWAQNRRFTGIYQGIHCSSYSKPLKNPLFVNFLTTSPGRIPLSSCVLSEYPLQ